MDDAPPSALPPESLGPGDPSQELARVQQQLLIFARDFKEFYRREQERTRELELALRELQAAYVQTAQVLATMAEWKTDPTTAQHLERTKRFALQVARRIVPDLADEPWLMVGFLLHDIGKAGIPESILVKEGPLTPKEEELMQTHPIIGAQWLEPIEFLSAAIPIVKQHHERWDGTGYPYGLTADEIHVGARIFSAVDAFDAMTSNRPYRKALSLEQALDELQRGGGSQFDPEVVRVVSDMWPELSELHGAVHA